MSQPTRLSLLEDLRETRSSDRWNEFFKAYGELLRKWMISQQVDPSDADDIQQETMLAVVKELPKFEHNGRPGAFRNWLRRILVHRIRRVWEKRQQQSAKRDLEQLADALLDESNQLSLEWTKEHDRYLIQLLLKSAEQQFSQDRIQMFRELVIDKEPPKSVAEKYGMTLGAVRVQQHRILSWLKSIGKGLVEVRGFES